MLVFRGTPLRFRTVFLAYILSRTYAYTNIFIYFHRVDELWVGKVVLSENFTRVHFTRWHISDWSWKQLRSCQSFLPNTLVLIILLFGSLRKLRCVSRPFAPVQLSPMSRCVLGKSFVVFFDFATNLSNLIGEPFTLWINCPADKRQKMWSWWDCISANKLRLESELTNTYIPLLPQAYTCIYTYVYIH